MNSQAKEYVIMGDPVPLARTRIGNKRCWDSQKALKLSYELQLLQQHGNLPLYNGPLLLDVVFYMPLPENMTLKKKALIVNNHHIYKPDTDNLVKLICDISSGVLYKDDCLISKISASKIYSYEPRTVFSIIELNKK